MSYEISHLDALESEAIHVFREVAAELEKPVLLFSGGKDSIVLLRLAEKAFRPGRFPFPLMHVDTGHNFPEVIEFRDRRIAELGERLIVASVQEAIDRGRVVEETGPRASRNRLQIVPLLELTEKSLGPAHRETGLAWNTRGVIAWQRGRIDEAIADIGRAVRIWRGPNGSQNLPGGLFVYGMVLHAAGREDQALEALRQSRALRAAQYGASHALIGDTDRMIGEVLASQGKSAEATVHFDRAVKLTRVGYGPENPNTLVAELSMARQLARTGHADDALKQLDALAVHPGTGSEIPKLHWIARAYAGETRCRIGQHERARRELDTLIEELRVARPDGGVITREAQAIRAACG